VIRLLAVVLTTLPFQRNAASWQVSPGVPTTFVQQLVHMDHHRRNATVLGEVNKNFVMTPDIDRLLDELRMHDGIIPGEEPKVKNEPGIVLQ
jgi:hypothetical protein